VSLTLIHPAPRLRRGASAHSREIDGTATFTGGPAGSAHVYPVQGSVQRDGHTVILSVVPPRPIPAGYLLSHLRGTWSATALRVNAGWERVTLPPNGVAVRQGLPPSGGVAITLSRAGSRSGT